MKPRHREIRCALPRAMRAIAMVAMLMTAMAAAAREKKITIYGEVYDSFTQGKVKAFVTVMNADSTVVDTTTCHTRETGTWSYYSVEVPREERTYIIKFTAEDYEDLFINYELKQINRNRYKEVPNAQMKRKQRDIYKDVELDGVVVRGTRIQVAYRGDTIVYDAAAFKMPEGSMLDGLIRQLPGAELKDNGDIYINGKKIDYLTLNGKDFFKDDNKVMLENLPYFTVKDIKVYNKQTEKSRKAGMEIEEPDYVMDVNLKREYARGYIANAEAGGGTNDRWMAKAFGMLYGDHTKVAVYGNMNNVNETRTPGSEGEWNPNKVAQGVKTVRQTGMRLSTEDKQKRVDESLTVRAEWEDSNDERVSMSETFSDNGSIFKDSRTADRYKGLRLSASNNLSFEKISLSSYTYLYYNEYENASAGRDSTYATALTNRNESIGSSRSKYLHIYENLYWIHNMKSGDLFYIDLTGTYTNSSPSESFGNTRYYYASTGTTDTQIRYRDNHSRKYTLNPELTYMFALPDEWQLCFRTGYYQRYDRKHNEVFNLETLPGADYDDIGWLPSTSEDMMRAFDEGNSKTYSIMQRSYSESINLQRYAKDMIFHLTLPFSHVRERMNYTGGGLDTLAHRTYNAFNPSVNFRTRGETKRPIEAKYSMMLMPAEFNTLMPSRDTSNPLYTVVANTGIRNTVRHDLSGRITFKNDSLGSSVYVGLTGRITHNEVGTRRTFNPQTGAYTAMRDNVNGNWNGALYGGIQRPIDKEKRLRIDLYGQVRYLRSVDFATATATTGGEEMLAESPLSKVDNVNLTATAKLNYKFGDLSCGINGRIYSQHTRGRLDIVQDIDANDFQYGANATYTIPVLKLTIATDLTMYSRRGYESSMMNTDELVWNAQLTRSFCKGKLTAKVQAYDLLQNLNSRRYSVNAQGRTETWYNYIPRYVMCSLAYKFTQKPKK